MSKSPIHLPSSFPISTLPIFCRCWRPLGWLLLLLVTNALSAQKPADLKRNGERYFAAGRWTDALTQLNQYQQAKPGDLTVLTKLGIAHYQLHQTDKARQFLEYVVGRPPQSTGADPYYYYARTLHGQQEYDKAILAYKGFLRICGDKHPLRAQVVDNIRRCVNAQGIGPNADVALVENLGDRVNTPGDEFAPLPSVNYADRLYFSAARPGGVGGRRNDAGYADEEAGHWCSDMFAAGLDASGWQYAGDLGGLLNTSRYEVALGFDNTGQILYFFRGFTLYAGDIFADTASRQDEYAVTPPMVQSTMHPDESDTAPFFFNDTTLVFASRQNGGYGGLDLYFTTRRDSIWTLPRNLGPAINSAYDETTPFLARDARTLFFSSNCLAGLGGLDVFKTVFDEKKNTWTDPQNLGTGINSPGDDAYFRLDQDGRQAFFSSDRLDDNYGERDLYLVYYKEQQAEQQPKGTVILFSELRKSGSQSTSEEVQTVAIEPLFYTSDRDVLSPDNGKVVDRAAAVARQNPSVKMLVTAFTDETGPAKFDLYYGIKRAELVGKALLERGIPAGQVLLRSVGAGFSLARNVLNAAPNPVGQRLNRRLELTLVSAADDLPTQARLERPSVAEVMATNGTAQLDELTKGLAYKVEVATTRQILTNDALAMFSELMIESQPGAGSYRYTAGFFKKYDQALKLRQELGQQGFEEPFVVAYVNGVRVSKADAVSLVKKYPDLAGYVK